VNQAQTALISAVTAAMVTLLIEFAAKPRLEARKDRVLELHRERRKLMAKLLILPYETRHVVLLASPGLAWGMGKAALQDAGEATGELQADLAKLGDLLSARQRELVGRLFGLIDARLMTLSYLVLLHETSGVITEENARRPLAAQLPMAEEFRRHYFDVITCLSGSYTLLALSKWKPWSYSAPSPPGPSTLTQTTSRCARPHRPGVLRQPPISHR
jgi:hypothetical protein